jgi:hypothetical protein
VQEPTRNCGRSIDSVKDIRGAARIAVVFTDKGLAFDDDSVCGGCLRSDPDARAEFIRLKDEIAPAYEAGKRMHPTASSRTRASKGASKWTLKL